MAGAILLERHDSLLKYRLVRGGKKEEDEDVLKRNGNVLLFSPSGSLFYCLVGRIT